jgi:hypothetical protein
LLKLSQNGQWGKHTIKGATQVNGHSLKMFFCMFEISQRKYNNLDCHKKFLEYFSLIENFTCSKFQTNQKCFCIFKIQTSRMEKIKIKNQTSFFFTKCAPFLQKIGDDFNIDD